MCDWQLMYQLSMAYTVDVILEYWTELLLENSSGLEYVRPSFLSNFSKY